MAAIGDSEGTVSIMQLCKALYETTGQEKEVMGQIFEREFRREKNLLTQKKLSKDPGGAKKVEKIDAEKEASMKEALKKIEEEFFTQVSKDDDLQAIKARGELNMEEAAKKE